MASALVPPDATFRRFFDTLSDGVALVDAELLTVRYANATLLHLLDRKLDEVRGLPLVALVGSTDVEPTLALARAPTEQHIGIELSTRDGTLVPVSLSIARVETPEGPVLGVIAFDLSGQQELMRVQNGRLHQLDRGKQEFIAMIGHELRNPLAPLRHAAELLDRAATANAAGPAVSELTQLIHRQVDHMARLVSDLLDVGRATTGQLPIRPQPMRVSEILVAAIESTAHLAEHRKQTMVRDCDDVDALELNADPVRLTQMLTNLLSNAVKFAPDGGHIELSCREEEGSLVIRVRDDGIGIRTDELAVIFEPFYQVRATLDRAGGGLGLGLALARSIVELHGGTVHASSNGLGHGSTFEVRLPGVTRRKPQPVTSSQPPTSRAALEVLVIDDNEDAAHMLALLLERRGCRVDVGFLGRVGLEKITAHRYDVAFIDIGLPDLDGYALAKLVAGTPTCPRQLVALTGYGQAEDRARALAAGFHEHVVKPMSPQLLDALLAAEVARSPQ